MCLLILKTFELSSTQFAKEKNYGDVTVGKTSQTFILLFGNKMIGEMLIVKYLIHFTLKELQGEN